ncbi:MAG: Mrp/NBP35 family ATP-binding protein [Chitinophagaceae bacterium]|nr:Mrp/NBP35 family ATP-binding protein [Chitinophagaceae bacterium]
MTQEQVLQALSQVQEPDLGKDLVTLNMIKDIHINDLEVSFTVVLTTPACPLKDHIRNACINAIHILVSKEAKVTVNFTANVNSNRKDNQNILPQVKNIIAVGSGKGGVGKSTVSVNLALALAEGGAKVGLLDADIYGPSIPIMLGIKGERPMMRDIDGKGMILPIDVMGIKVMSIGLLIDDRQAVVWRGPMASSAIRQFVSDVLWEELDYLIIDLPPGTGDIHLTMVQTIPVTGSVIVTTPQEVALEDAKKAIMMFNGPQIKVPILGVVENMSFFTPPELPENKYYIFGQGGGLRLAERFEVPFLGQLPINMSMREGGDQGKPAYLYGDSISKEAIQQLAMQVARQVSIRNANLTPTQLVEVTV